MKAIFAVGNASSAAKYMKGRHVLFSFAYWPRFLAEGEKRGKDESRFLVGIEKHLDLFASIVFDSGEFTNWQRQLAGKSQSNIITLEKYAEFLTTRAPKHEWALSMDMINDKRAGRGSLEQHLRLLSLLPTGHPLVPVFHEGDDLGILDEYVAMSRLVALGRIEGRLSKRKGLEFYDLCFNRYPNHAFHALGNSSPDLEPYPWESFDATTWERNAAYSHALPWPYNRTSKHVRMLAHIEAIETLNHTPPAQLSLGLNLNLDLEE